MSAFMCMQQTQFVKFTRDVGIVGEDATSEALSPLLDADIEVAYTAQVNKKDRDGPKRMQYNDFLTTIMNLSKRVSGIFAWTASAMPPVE